MSGIILITYIISLLCFRDASIDTIVFYTGAFLIAFAIGNVSDNINTLKKIFEKDGSGGLDGEGKRKL